jgi:peptidoglycan/xylan/chitin deacetylase (PgdA/CDA1 family)
LDEAEDPEKTGVIIFLVYHRIAAGGDERSIAPHAFRGHLEAIRDAEVPVIDASETERLSGPGRGVVLSFDDATSDHFAAARPILAEFGMPGLFYVPTARLDTPGHLSTGQVAGLSHEGHTIGSHSHTHSRLDRLNEAAVRRELALSRARIQSIVGSPPLHFAPPGGLYLPSALALSDQLGYRFFRSMKWGLNPAPAPREIRVVPMTAASSAVFLAWALHGRHDLALRLMHRCKVTLERALPEGAYRRLRTRVTG